MDINNIIQCRKCKRMFRYSGYGAKLCPECRKIDDEEFAVVRDYLLDHPKRNIIQTSEDCHIPVKTIQEWLREDRLEYAEPEGSGLLCEKCGKPIKSGILCDDCKMAVSRAAGELARSFEKQKEVITPKKTHNGDRMRFLSR